MSASAARTRGRDFQSGETHGSSEVGDEDDEEDGANEEDGEVDEDDEEEEEEAAEEEDEEGARSRDKGDCTVAAVVAATAAVALAFACASASLCSSGETASPSSHERSGKRAATATRYVRTLLPTPC